MKVYSELKSLGFFEWLNDEHCLEEDGSANEHLDGLKLGNIALTAINSLAFRWFREKYSLFIAIVHYDNGYSINDLRRFDTYEEAELACIERLIEIVKNNKS